MPDDFEQQQREDRDRNPHYPRDYYERPTAISLFQRLGYDVTNNDDVQRLAADLRWVAEKRQMFSEQKARRIGILISGFIAIGSVALTMFGTWVLSKMGIKP